MRGFAAVRLKQQYPAGAAGARGIMAVARPTAADKASSFIVARLWRCETVWVEWIYMRNKVLLWYKRNEGNDRRCLFVKKKTPPKRCLMRSRG